MYPGSQLLQDTELGLDPSEIPADLLSKDLVDRLMREFLKVGNVVLFSSIILDQS